MAATEGTLHSKDHLHQVTDHLLEDGTFAAKLENIIHERITEIPNPSPTSKQVFMNTEPVREIVTSTIIDQVPQLVRATMIAELETLVLETIHTSIPRIQEAVKDEFCLLYTSPSPRDQRGSRMPSSA